MHVSGHASQEEQKLMLNLVKPKHFLPIHGELRQLTRHAALAEEVGIPKENIIVVENGQIVELSGGNVRLGERIPGEYIFVDGESIGDIDRRSHARTRNAGSQRNPADRHQPGQTDRPTAARTGDRHARLCLTAGRRDAHSRGARRVMEMVNGGGLGNQKDIVSAVKSYLHESDEAPADGVCHAQQDLDPKPKRR